MQKNLISKDKPSIVLAPMADYTDSPFCHICRIVSGNDFLIFREMVSSEALVRNSVKTLQMCEFIEEERPIVVQVFGADPNIMAQAVKIIDEKFRPDGIDINMGCPVPKITKKNLAGAALMKDPEQAVKIIKAVRKENPNIFLSVKTRLGWTDKKDILKFAPQLEKAGAQALTIHGRTKDQGYSGQADWEMIAQVKKILSIPVIANGDIQSKEDIKKCLEITKADGVMIGRAALGNPWIFSDKQPSTEERFEIILKHAKLHLEHYGENSLIWFRKHLLWYFRSNRVELNSKIDIKEVRKQLVQVKKIDELENIIHQLR